MSTRAVRLAANTNAAAERAADDRTRGDHGDGTVLRRGRTHAIGDSWWAEAEGGSTVRRVGVRPGRRTGTTWPRARRRSDEDHGGEHGRSSERDAGERTRRARLDGSHGPDGPDVEDERRPDAEDHALPMARSIGHEHHQRPAARRQAELAPLPLVGSGAPRLTPDRQGSQADRDRRQRQDRAHRVQRPWAGSLARRGVARRRTPSRRGSTAASSDPDCAGSPISKSSSFSGARPRMNASRVGLTPAAPVGERQ